jgi:hypothetical protein
MITEASYSHNHRLALAYVNSDQNPRAGRSAGGHCSLLSTTREPREQVSGVVAPMNAPHCFEAKN